MFVHMICAAWVNLKIDQHYIFAHNMTTSDQPVITLSAWGNSHSIVPNSGCGVIFGFYYVFSAIYLHPQVHKLKTHKCDGNLSMGSLSCESQISTSL